MMATEVTFKRLFALTPEAACDRIEAEIAALKAPRARGKLVYQRLIGNAVLGYIEEARAASTEAKKWRSIAEATFWWAAALSLGPDAPFCQAAGAAGNTAAADARAKEAQRVHRDGDPRTGEPWRTQEDCVSYLQGIGLGPRDKRVHSRGAIMKALKRKLEV